MVKTKLRHFAHTTSPQFTALSRGKRLPLTASDSPPISPSTLSPLMVSISLTELKPQQPGTVQSTSSAAAPPLPSSMRKKRRRPSNKVRPTALSSFVMKKRASSPSTHSDGGSPCPPPPPAKTMQQDMLYNVVQVYIPDKGERSLSGCLLASVHILFFDSPFEPPQDKRGRSESF